MLQKRVPCWLFRTTILRRLGSVATSHGSDRLEVFCIIEEEERQSITTYYCTPYIVILVCSTDFRRVSSSLKTSSMDSPSFLADTE